MIEAKELKGGKRVKPYLKIYQEGAVAKSKVKKYTLSPEWNESFVFLPFDHERCDLKVEIWNKFIIGFDKLMVRKFQKEISHEDYLRAVLKSIWINLMVKKLLMNGSTLILMENFTFLLVVYLTIVLKRSLLKKSQQKLVKFIRLKLF